MRQAGSLAKLVILVAALRNGATADTLLCPRAASDGGRPLRRQALRVPHGYQDCTPAQTVRLHDAIATSDNLAFYDLARQLGREQLLIAARTLGLPVEGELLQRPAYALSFGTLLLTPAQMLDMGRQLFGVAYGIPVQHQGSKLLMGP